MVRTKNTANGQPAYRRLPVNVVCYDGDTQETELEPVNNENWYNNDVAYALKLDPDTAGPAKVVGIEYLDGPIPDVYKLTNFDHRSDD